MERIALAIFVIAALIVAVVSFFPTVPGKEPIPQFLTVSDLFQRVLGDDLYREQGDLKVYWWNEDSLIYIDHYGEYKDKGYALNLNGVLLKYYSSPSSRNWDDRKTYTRITFGEYVPYKQDISTRTSQAEGDVVVIEESSGYPLYTEWHEMYQNEADDLIQKLTLPTYSIAQKKWEEDLGKRLLESQNK